MHDIRMLQEVFFVTGCTNGAQIWLISSFVNQLIRAFLDGEAENSCIVIFVLQGTHAGPY